MVTQEDSDDVAWVLLSYRLPREPSTPRIAVWRKLKRLGVEQIGDGLVALPLDARTREHLEWIAADVIAADGDAMVWRAHTTRSDSARLVERMRAARDEEYRTLIDEIDEVAAGGAELDPRSVHRLRRTLRKINRRDYFRASLRDRARLVVDGLAAARLGRDASAPS